MKILLLDADGVVLKKGELFSEKFSREHEIPIEGITPFFKEELGDCQKGVKDLKEVLPTYLEKWGWEKGVDAFLDYWFEDIQLHPEIEAFVARCKEIGVKCMLASNNEHYRARAIEAKLGDMLDGYFFSSDLKVKKNNLEFFRQVSKELAIAPSEIGFTDNEEQNVEAAKEVGIEAMLYKEGLFTEWHGVEIPTEFMRIS